MNLFEEISKHGFTCDFTVAKQQIKNQIDMNINLMQEWKKTIDKYEKEIREFSINILVIPQKQVYLSRRNNIVKDYYNYFQCVTGLKEKEDKTFEECAIRETLEEANIKINIEDLNFINIYTEFHLFPDGNECMFRTTIFFTIIDKEPEQTKSEKHDDWFLCDLKDLKKF